MKERFQRGEERGREGEREGELKRCNSTQPRHFELDVKLQKIFFTKQIGMLCRQR